MKELGIRNYRGADKPLAEDWVMIDGAVNDVTPCAQLRQCKQKTNRQRIKKASVILTINRRYTFLR